MKTIIPPLYERNIDILNPFKNDAFNRGAFAQNLTYLFRNTSDGLVITINAKWGDGKTTFIKLWELQLKNDDDFIPIYYNAFKNDFSGDVFMSIAVSIHEAIKNKLLEEGKDPNKLARLKYLKSASKELAKDLIQMGAGIAVSSITGGLINNKTFLDWVVNSFKKLTFGTLRVNIDEQFESYNRSQKNIIDYQNQLRSLLFSNIGNKTRKVVFLIDELDRCRPDFAVELIEKVKHLFNIENVFFVLAINTEQLLSTIASVYGVTEKESFIYLQKFIHIQTQLPPMLTGDDELTTFYLEKFFDDIVKEYEIDEKIIPNSLIYNGLIKLIKLKLLELNPRAIERIMSFVSIAINSCDSNIARGLAKNIVIMSALKIGRPDLYEKFKSGKIISDEDTQLFNWLKTFYEGQREDTASNVFKVRGLEDACKLLDIYEIPSSEDIEKEKIKMSK